MNAWKNFLQQYRQQISYLFFGVLTTVINYASFWIVIFVFGTEVALVANAIAFVLATAFAFLTNKAFVFQSNVWNMGTIFKEGTSFVVTRLFSFGIEEAGLFLCMTFLPLNQIRLLGIDGTMLSKIALSVLAVLLNYFFSKRFVFSDKKGEAQMIKQKLDVRKVLLIIPAYNEEANIQATIEQIRSFQPRERYQLDYIVINDGSTDATEQVCQENGIHYMTLVQNLGIGGAVQSGYRYAKEKKYDVAVQFDGDGQHDIRYLDDLLMPIIEGRADFSIGSRFKERTSSFQSTALRRVGIHYLSFLIKLLCRTKVTDPTSGFRAASGPVISFLADHYPVDYPEPESIITLTQNHFNIEEVPVNMFERAEGKSSITFRRSIYYMCKVSLAIFCISIHGKRCNHVTIS